jgi:predicted Zn-ribbon and HTH transcriptional regulator
VPFSNRRPLIAAGLLLGVGLGGFVDGIVFHQILQWHNMLTDPGYYPKAGVGPETVIRNMQVAGHFSELDAQDEYETSQNEDEPLLDIEYRCPECGHEWTEQWTCACDSECPNCGTEDIVALDWSEHHG